MGHKYCQPGSVMFPFDGDDNLVGRQVFRLLNAIYQERKARFVYLNFLQFFRNRQELTLSPGYSREVLPQTKKTRTYRQRATPLHLRCWMSDLFLNVSEADYKMNG